MEPSIICFVLNVKIVSKNGKPSLASQFFIHISKIRGFTVVMEIG